MSESCKDCGKPGYEDKAAGWQHDRRSTQGNAPDGKERRATIPVTPAVPNAPKPEKPPKRRHWLHSRWFGLVPD